MNTISTIGSGGSIQTTDFKKLSLMPHSSDTEAKMLDAVDQTRGLIMPAEALSLYRLCQRLPQGARILEIGSYLGASTTAMGHAAIERKLELYCLDCWHDYETQGFFDHALSGTTHTDGTVFLSFLRNTSFLGEQIRILKGLSRQFADLLPTGFFDLVYIDAAHDYASVFFDIQLGMRILKTGGILCGHDYHSDGPGVTEAVNELIADSPQICIKGVIPETSIWYAVAGV